MTDTTKQATTSAEPAPDAHGTVASPAKEKTEKRMAFDPFLRNRKYPDADGIFQHLGRNPGEMLHDCIVVLDTNALLIPYSTSASSMGAIEVVYRKLATDGRLVVPAQAVREFADHRGTKLGELVQQLTRKRDLQLPRTEPHHALLEGDACYQKMLSIEKDLHERIKEYRKLTEQLAATVRGWAWNDPVSRSYAQIFKGVVREPEADRDAVLKDLRYRLLHKIPPGYKDGAKDDEGIGDLLIWLVVLEVGKENKSDALFVTGEEKSDWWYRAEKQPICPRYELVDEYRRASGGRSFAMCKLSDLLDLMSAAPEAISETRKVEERAAALKREAVRAGEEAREHFQDALRIVRAVTEVSGSQTSSAANLEAMATRVAGQSEKRERKLRLFEVYCDYETSERAGAGGSFQVILLSEDGRDMTHLVNQGIHFADVEHLERYLKRATGDDVLVEEQG